MRNLQEQPSEPTLYTHHRFAGAELEALSAKPLGKLTRRTADSLAVNRLLLGRCLVAIDSTSAYEYLGCSGSIHYASLLGPTPFFRFLPFGVVYRLRASTWGIDSRTRPMP